MPTERVTVSREDLEVLTEASLVLLRTLRGLKKPAYDVEDRALQAVIIRTQTELIRADRGEATP